MARNKKTDPAHEVLNHVDVGRREALRRMLTGAAFIAPALITLPLAYGSPDPQAHPFPTPRPKPTRRHGS